MAGAKDIFTTKFVKEKLVGNTGSFFNSLEEINQYNKSQQRHISDVYYGNPNNFARFGLAEEYYKNSITYINSNYPYNAGKEDKISWINSLSEFEYYIFTTEFPRAYGYVELSGSQNIEVRPYVLPENLTKKTYETNQNSILNKILEPGSGFTFETWLKIDSDINSCNIITINGITSSGIDLIENEILSINKKFTTDHVLELSGNNNQYEFSHVMTPNEWHHYAVQVSSNAASLFVDGILKEQLANINILDETEYFVYTPKGLMYSSVFNEQPDVSSFSDIPLFVLGGGAKLSLDETRFWNGARAIENIGRYWFTNIDGNNFSDSYNSNLLFYYKFNEGWDKEYGFLCLDYSGYNNDGEIKSYSNTCRVSESALNISGLLQDSEKSDIIFKGLSYSSDVKSYYDNKIEAGVLHDETNIHSLYKKFPSWVLEQEEENQIKHLKQIIQIISSYFDDLYNKIGEIVNYKTIKHGQDKENIYPFYDKILSSAGFDFTDLFANMDMIENISSRNDITTFDLDVQKVKNSILQNIYNNLHYILKSKGTEKSIKSFLRSYGINEDLVRINLYANNTDYDIYDRSKEKVVKKKTIQLKDSNNIYLLSSVQEDSTLRQYTLESCFYLPNGSDGTNFTNSIFGIQNNQFSSSTDQSTSNYEYNVFIENNILSGSRFTLSGSGLGTSSSGYFADNFDNTVWNLALRKKANVDTLYGSPSTIEYIFELYGVNSNTDTLKEFSCSLGPVPHTDGFLKYYIGASRSNITGSTINNCNSKFLYCNFWTDYLNNEDVKGHNKDILNYGISE